MKSINYLTIFIMLCSNLSFGQVDTTLYGITRDAATQELYLSKINPLNGTVTNISSTPFSTTFILNTLATIDPINELYYLHSQDTLFGIDLNTGDVVHNYYISTPELEYFDLMNFNCTDTTLYGIMRNGTSQALYLSKINPLNGIVTNISPSPISSTFVMNTLATIDPSNELFYLHSQDTLFGIDLNTGNVVYNSYISTPFTGYFDLMTFNPDDTTLYGITRDAATQALYLSKINPQNGIVTTISTTPFSTTYVMNALATIDPVNELFYLHSQDTLFGIDLNTGNVVYNSYVSTPITGYFDMMTYFPDTCKTQSTAGIQQTTNEQESGIITIYPNPTRQVLNIKSTLKTDYQIDIYNVGGKLVKSADPHNSKLFEIDLKSLDTGLYTIVIHNETGVLYTEKIVKH